jgi:two-component system, NarL family, nitrate/nitrite response regulator NarL
MQEIHVALVEKNQLFREGLRVLLERHFTSVAEAADADEALACVDPARASAVDLLILSGVGAAESLERLDAFRRHFPKSKIVVLADHGSPGALASAMNAGIDGYLSKDTSSDALVQSLILVNLGEKMLPADLAMSMLNDQRQPKLGAALAATPARSLSVRETQILRFLLSGYSNKAIARQLNIAEATVKVHLKGVLRKVNAANRTQAAIWALSHGLTGDVAPQQAVAN